MIFLLFILSYPQPGVQIYDPPPFEEVWGTLQEILSQSEFELDRPREEDTFNLEPLLFILGISAVIAALTLLGLGVRASLISDRSVKTISDEEGKGEIFSSQEAFKEFSKLEREGDLCGAVRAAYLATLLFLYEKGLLRYEVSATDGEYLKQLRSNEKIYTLFAELSRIFADIRYGNKLPDQGMVCRCRLITEEVRRAVS